MRLKPSYSVVKKAAAMACLLLNATWGLHAQTVDSSYHNYLYDSKLAYFKQLPPARKALVFWGDSITDWGDWAELLNFKRLSTGALPATIPMASAPD